MRLRSMLMMGALLGAAGCCGDTSALLQVHVVDGTTGAAVSSPTVLVDGDPIFCGDDQYSAPVADGFLADDGFVSAPDGFVSPPASTDAGTTTTASVCNTYAVWLDAGRYTVQVQAQGYFGNSERVNLGDGGNSFSCPSPHDVETTIALYGASQ